MKTHKITLNEIKYSDGWSEMMYALKFDTFKKEHPELHEDDDELHDLFYEKITEIFKYGEFGSLEIIIDENLNIIDGKILPFKK